MADKETYNVVIEDDSEHSGGRLFCYDLGHECHDNEESLQEVNDLVRDGLMSEQDADNYFHGRTI